MISQFSVHLANLGYRPQSPVIADGKLRRVAWEGRPKSDKTGWTMAWDHGDWAAAAWGDWREGVSERWCSRENRKMAPAARMTFAAEMAEGKARLAAEQEQARKAAEARAWVLWSRADLAEWHPYLNRKCISGAGLRIDGGALLVPLRDADGLLANVQRIMADGSKRFVRAAAVSGMAWYLGPLPATGGNVVICEGVATSATVHQLSGWPTVAAMNAGNLVAVAEIVRARCPSARILIAADDDRWEKDGTPRAAEKNVGILKARAAAAAVRGLVVPPVFPGIQSRGTDWNDLLCAEGGETAADIWEAGVKLAMLDAQVGSMSDAEFAGRKVQVAAAYKAAGADASPKALASRRKEAKPVAVADEDESPAETLARLAAEPELWHDQFGQACATFDLDGRRVNARVESQTFSDWLRMAWEDEAGTAAPPSVLMVNTCVSHLASRARSRGRRVESFVRIGWDKGTRYMDLGRPDWEVVRIDASGWQVVGESPVKFTRGDGNWELPVPVRMPGGLDPLWALLNVAEDDRCLIAGWLLGSLMGTAPAFGLNLHGSQGTAKSTATRILRRMIDPAPGLTQMLNVRRLDDLPLTCLDQWVPCFENISWLEDEVQDALCMLTTGLSLRNRKLYSDATMVSYNVRRPWIINGINNVCSRNDLSERAVPVGLLSLDPRNRKRETEIEAAFEAAWPGLLAALLDAAAMASAPEMQAGAAAMLEREGLSHRMADALVWITAGEEALGFAGGSFIRRLGGLQEEAGREALEDHPVILTLEALLDGVAQKTSSWTVEMPVEWTGGNDDLLSAMEDFCPGRKLPKGCDDARKLGMWLKREADRIRKAFGIEIGNVARKSRSNRHRVRTIRRIWSHD